MKLLFDNGDQQVSANGAPDLRFYGVFAGAQKAFDTQMLLDPFEEQLDLPAALVQRRDDQGRQRSVVGQEDQRFAGFWVFEADASQVLGVVFADVKPVQGNALVAHQSAGAIHLGRINASGIHAALGAGHEESADLMQFVQTSKVQVAPIHHVERAWLDGQDVQDLDLVHLAVADMDEGGDIAPQVQERVQLDRRFGRAKRCPIEQGQTQVYRGRVQRVDRRVELLQFGREVFGVQGPCARDKAHRQRVVDAPVAQVQRVGQRGACGHVAQPHVKQLGLVGLQASLDVAQGFAPGQLRKGHDAKQIRAAQRANARIPGIPVDDAAKGLPRRILHHLRKQRLANVHEAPQVV